MDSRKTVLRVFPENYGSKKYLGFIQWDFLLIIGGRYSVIMFVN